MQETLPEKIGHYDILKSLGKGGMGEVFLAFDTLCKRTVALKCIRQDLCKYEIIKERFLREAHVAARLTHPSIIPIFSIETTGPQVFYTMPFVEGQTLKEILRITYAQEKEGEANHPIGSSTLALARIFLSVCEAIAYTHAKGIIHRDIKPDNIIVGKYGEVLILDWGLADLIGKKETFSEETLSLSEDYKDLTRPGKVPGTLNYIAPERVQGDLSDVTVDIYSLGVILYQLLTLKLPFRRSTLKSFRKTMHLETLRDPLEAAPHRDIPQHLADIAKRCLRFAKEERFQSVDAIIEEVKSFLEGRPEWIPTAVLKIDSREDWEFQENILMTKHLAITRSADVMEWVNLMISKASFTGNIKLEADFKLGIDSQGIGFLVAVPDVIERKGWNEGYCLWLGTPCYLYRNNVEVMFIQEAPLSKETWYHVTIEKVDHHLTIFLNDQVICKYISHTPATGSHVGLLARDADFELRAIKLSVGSQNAMINCLAIPDAFLGNKNYAKALLEYRRIANSFSGRAEGREALFRAGVTLLEAVSQKKDKKAKDLQYLLALEEFGKLRFTPGAPLEYLGKSLVYKASGEIEEEIKCLELCLRKYPKHPLLSLIKDQIIFRLHESSSKDRVAAYHFALLALSQLPLIFTHRDHKNLISSLKKHLENLPFFLPASSDTSLLITILSFWIPKPFPLIEIIENGTDERDVGNAVYALFALGLESLVEETPSSPEQKEIAIALCFFQKSPKAAFELFFKTFSSPFNDTQERCLYFLLDQALLQNQVKLVDQAFTAYPIPETPLFDALKIQAALLQSDWETAKSTLEKYPVEELSNEYSPFYSLMGCYLKQKEGREIALSHFSGSIDLPHPPTTMLLSYFLKKKISLKKGWITHAFPWEKIQLYRQLQLYYHSANEFKKRDQIFKQIKKEFRNVKSRYSAP